MYLNETFEQYVLSCGLTVEAVDETLENYHIKEKYFKQLLWSLFVSLYMASCKFVENSHSCCCCFFCLEWATAGLGKHFLVMRGWCRVDQSGKAERKMLYERFCMK